MKKNLSSVIGLKNTVILIFLIIVFFSAIGFILYNNSSEALLKSICQSFENRATDNSRLLAQTFQDKLTATKLIAENHEIKSMNWEIQKAELLSHINTLEVKRFRVSDRNGIARSTDGYITNLSDRVHFQKALRGIPNISDVVKSKVRDELLISCVVPITDSNNHIVGALGYAIDYKVLKDMISKIKVGKNGYAVLMNNKGVAVVHPDIPGESPNISIFDRVKKDSSLTQLVNLEKNMMKGNAGSGFFKEGKLKKYMAYSPVEGTNWYIGLVVPEHEIFSYLTSLKTKFIIVTILFIILAFYMLNLILVYLSQKQKVVDLEKSAEDNYKQMLEITELDKLKTEFFSNLSHELRTPLNVVLSTLQLFEQYTKGDINKNKDKIIKHTSAIKQNCFRLLRLINNLLDITRIDAGFYELHLRSVDIVNFIEELTESIQEYANNNGLTLTFSSNMKQKYINCDAEKVERIVLNLISNAIKFTPRDGLISVNISNNQSHVIISVKDTGIGIPEDRQSMIFERFRQVERTLTRNYEGSGIGLSLAKSLVEMHKGNISVKSWIGAGSEFIVEIPANLEIDKLANEQITLSDISSGIYEEKVRVELSELVTLRENQQTSSSIPG